MNNPINSLRIRKATPDDLPAIYEIVRGTKLPTEGIADHVSNFLVAEFDGKVVGTIGLEIYQSTGLLRSAAILPKLQNRGVGNRLFNVLIDYAKEEGISELFLLTETARDYFARKGFTEISRQEVRAVILSSEEFKSCCPTTAVCMKKKL